MAIQELASNQGHNWLIEALPPKDRQSLIAKTERVTLPTRELLYEANEPIRSAYFPLSGVMSMVSNLGDDLFLEVGTIGNEGVVGVPVVLGVDNIPFRVFAQVPGDARKISAEALREEMSRSRPLQVIINRYLQALFTQFAQSVACNRMHTIEQRFARWMLMTRDRVQSDEFPIRPEFIAQMLGAPLETIGGLAADMQAAGLINYTNGVMRILDPAGFEARACVCYRIIRDEYDIQVRGQALE